MDGKTDAIGIIVRKGKYGGTYAHKDIAFEFGSAISVLFKIYLIEEFQRLKEQEQAQIGWSAKRELSKINYRIHTDAIKQNLIPGEITPQQASRIYASEADVLNVAMFGMTALEWRDAHPGLKGNVRDYAGINELICLSNMENLNAVFINDGLPQHERLVRLNRIAIQQMQLLEDVNKKYLKITPSSNILFHIERLKCKNLKLSVYEQENIFILRPQAKRLHCRPAGDSRNRCAHLVQRRRHSRQRHPLHHRRCRLHGQRCRR